MKKKYFCTAFAAALLFAGFAFTACDDDDDNSAPGTKPTIKFENVIPTKNYVQSGTFAAVAPGQTTSFTFHAAKGQRLMFATMYSNSNDLFFAPENPGIQLFNDSGVPYTGIIADAVKLWDNGTRVNEQPGPDVNHPGVAQAGVVTEVKGTDSEGHNYLAASSLLQVSLTFDAAQSLFTCTISNISAGTANETPFSGGVFVVSNLLDGDLVMDKPFFSVDQKSGVELTKLAEAGNVDPLKSLVADQTGIITTLHGAIVVVYTGNTNPIYQLGQKDAQLGLAALAQRGDPSQLKASLEKVPQVRKIYTLTDTVLPGKSMECTYEAAANEKVAFATMFGYSNDWFFANGPELNALTNADRAGAEDEDFLFPGLALLCGLGLLLRDELGGFVVAVVGGVEVRGVGRELSGTGIDHLKTSAVVFHGELVHLGQTLDGLILEAVLLGFLILGLAQNALALGQTLFEVCQMLHLVEEPPVDLGDAVNGLVVDAALEGLIDAEDALGILHMHVVHDLVVAQLLEGLVGQGVHAQLDGRDGLHHGSLKAAERPAAQRPKGATYGNHGSATP